MKSFTAMAARAAVATALLCAVTAHAAERDSLKTYFFPGVVVVANGVQTPLNEVGGSVTVISAEQLRSSQKTALLDVLREAPGVDVTRTGGPGGQTSVFLRGANSEHTLILVDGVEMNDLSNPSGAFDFATLGVENVERVEILRGSQSVLYGSDAIGGVINIVTREGRGKPTITASAEGGAFNTFREELALRGAGRRGSYSLSVSRSDADGISATESLSVNEADGSAVTSFSGKLRMNLTERATASLIARGSRSHTALDKSYGSFDYPGSFDDPNYDSDARQVFVKGEVDATLTPNRLRTLISAEFSAHRRRITDSDDATFGTGSSDNQYDGEKFRAQARIIAEIAEWHKLSAGVETERELMNQRAFTEITGASARTTGVYLFDQLSFAGRVYLTAGLRSDNHEFFGSHTTYRVTASALVNNHGTRLKGSLNSGFNAPSLVQLFDPFYGDTGLQPEESAGWELGFEQALTGDRARFGVTWFSQNVENIFGFDPSSFVTINVDRAEVDGAGLFVEWRAARGGARVDYTYTDARDKADGSALLRRAKNKLSARAKYAPDARTDVGLLLTHIGSRADNDFEVWPAERVRLAPYTLVTLTASRTLSGALTVFGRIENVFDEDYVEVSHFATPGRNAHIGVRITL